MNQKKFFKQLKDELHGHPYRERFLEELEDHVEDLEEEQLNDENWRHRMGKPLGIKETFVKIMHPFRQITFYLEALIYGFLLFPVNIVIFSTASEGLTTGSGLMVAIFKIIIYLGILFIFYFVCIKRYLNLKLKTSKSPVSWIILLISPSFLWQFLQISSLIYSIFSAQSELDFYLKLSFFQYLAFYVLSGIILYLAWKMANFKQKEKPSNKYKWSLLIKKIIFTYFIGFLIFRTLSTYIDPNLIQENNLWAHIFSPLTKLEIGVSFITQIILYLFNLIFSKEVSLFINLYLPGFILVVLAGHSLWVMIKNKKIFFLRMGLIAYVFSLFLINVETYEGKKEFEVESITVSKILEKHEATIFYRPMKYFNHDEGKLFRYAANFEDGVFKLQNNTGKIFTIDPDRINGPLKDQQFNVLVTETERFPFHEEWKGITSEGSKIEKIDWPGNITCEKKKFREESDTGGEPVYYYSGRVCEKIFYKNELVIEDDYLSIADVDFSDDGKWMMLINERTYDPDDVYLVKLAD